MTGPSARERAGRRPSRNGRDPGGALERMAEALDCAVYELDCESGRIVWTTALTAGFGYPPDVIEAGYDWWHARVHPDDSERAEREYLAALASGREMYAGEYRFETDDGNYRDVLDRATIVRGSDGSPVRVVGRDGHVVWVHDESVVVHDDAGRPLCAQGFLLDITERKRIEDALRRSEAILRAVSFAAERFLRARSWPEVIADVLGRLGEAASASRVYIFENEGVAGGRVLTSQRCEWVAEGIAEVGNAELQRHRLPAEWAVKLARGLVVCESADEWPLEVRPLLAGQGICSLALVPVVVEQEWWGFFGFDECREEREWSPAETDALRAAAGTLGAAVQRERAEQGLQKANDDFQTVAAAIKCAIYEWDVGADEVYWTEGVAAAFGYSLDEVSTSYEWWLGRIHPDRSVQREATRERARGSETILLAEDEPAVRALVHEILTGLGYGVIGAANGADALELAASVGRIELLVTDVVMPGVGGPELAERLAAERPGLRVLFMSGYTQNAVSDRAALPPGHDFLPKPFSPGELEQRVRGLLDALPPA